MPGSQPIAAMPSDAPAAAARASHSRFVQRVQRRYADDLPRLPSGLPDAAAIGAVIDGLQRDGRTLAQALRVARQLVLERLAVLDVEQGADMQAVTRTMTALAEVTLDRALAAVLAEQDARHGVPRNAAGERIEFWIVGMGKLGARELNV